MLLVTGATGFVGRTLLRHLGDRTEVRLLVRQAASGAGLPYPVAVGDLGDPASLDAALSGVTSVLHLAALTGKARQAAFEAVNAAGTRNLLEAARRAGVGSVVLASTIAATYPDKRHYPYASSKERAEQLLRASGIHHAILRPTVILGRGSPVGASLASLAALPLLPIFGRGDALVQPVHVDDVARALLVLLESVESGRCVEGAFDLGGPEAVAFGDFMRRLGEAVTGRATRREARVPVRLITPLLTLLEPLFLPVMPVTAGQLAAFVNDGSAREGRLDLPFDLCGLDAMIAETAADRRGSAP